jgi:hypothetical protein
MAKKHADAGAEIRDTVVKSSLTGVAASIVAVTLASPAGFGGVIGTSIASTFGADNANASTDDVYASLPAFPAPLTQTELSDIRGQLARTTASLEITRAATDERIERIRSIAMSEGVTTFAPVREASRVGGGLSVQSPMAAELSPVVATPSSAVLQPEGRDVNMELAALLLAHENI